MAITMPNIDIQFKQLSASLIARSERGIAVIIIKDLTSGAVNYAEYVDITKLSSDQSKYTATNFQYLKDVFSYVLNKVVVVNMGETGTVSEALAVVENKLSTGWITLADGEEEDFNALALWIKSKESLKKSYKAITYKATTTDCKHIVNFANDTVTFADSRGEVTGEKATPLLVGLLASCNILRGCTYYKITSLVNVEEVADRNVALQAGKFILFNDGDAVRVALGLNSMTTISGNDSEDMRFIDIVEAMDLIQDDVASVFKNEYIGNKNKLDNQILFISAVNGYFKSIAEIDVLDSDYLNVASINTIAQREAWVASGNTEASTWDDAKVRNMTFKRDMFIAGDVKILGTIVHLDFSISLV